MFYEIDPALMKESHREKNKRWFRDADRSCDIFLWEKNGVIEKFQIWYEGYLLEWGEGKSIRTGEIQTDGGAFISYQSEIYRLHHHWQDDLLAELNAILQSQNKEAEGLFESLTQILDEYSSKR